MSLYDERTGSEDSGGVKPERPDGSQYPYYTGAQAPQNGGTQYPYNADTQAPQNGGTQYPYNADTQAPQNGGTQYPYYGGEQAPQNGGTQYPYNADTQAPQNGGMQYPYYTGEQAPQNGGMQYPYYTGAQAPQYGGTQYPYNGGAQYPYPYQRYASPFGGINPEQAHQKSLLKKLSNAAGIGVLGFLALANLVTLPLIVFGASAEILGNNAAYYAFDTLASILYVGLPFLLIYFYQKRIMPKDTYVPTEKPTSAALTVSLIFGGLLICVVGSYITSYITSFIEGITGISLLDVDIGVPEGVFGAVIFAVRFSLAPALIEEFAMRGVIMQPLRRYGDRFAIIMTAMVFALLHGNLIQIPFAFIAGCMIGYAVIQTNSLWTGVIIHLLNNALSVVQSLMFEKLGDSTLLYIPTVIIAVIGVPCIIYFFVKKPFKPLHANRSLLTTKSCVRCYIFSPAMIIAIVIMAIQTLLATSLFSDVLEQAYSLFG